LPESWPGRTAANAKPRDKRGEHVEKLLGEDLAELLGDRFHPCIELHEFESLLYVNPELSALSIAIGAGYSDADDLAEKLSGIKEECGGSVEHIDDSPETAPSKRLIAIVPGYRKVLWGVTAAADTGVEALRAGCPWLERWLASLEGVGQSSGGAAHG
jgi:hypothetical protein